MCDATPALSLLLPGRVAIMLTSPEEKGPGASMAMKRLGILTGGGDVPGLNSVIKSVVYRGSELGYEVVGIRRGWEGLTHVDLQDPASRARYVLPLNRQNTRTIDRTGGTYLHTSRTSPSRMPALPPALAGQDFPTAGSPGTGITYDVTEAVQRNIELLMADKRNNPSNYALVIVSEGAEWEGYTVKEYGPADAFGHRKKMSVAEDLSNEIKAATGEETIVSDLTYELRSGSPDFVDRLVASTFADMAVDASHEGKQNLMTAVTGGCFALQPIPDPALGPRKVDVPTMYNTERYRPTYDCKLGLPIFLTRE